jgi:hypothetical protein
MIRRGVRIQRIARFIEASAHELTPLGSTGGFAASASLDSETQPPIIIL